MNDTGSGNIKENSTLHPSEWKQEVLKAKNKIRYKWIKTQEKLRFMNNSCIMSSEWMLEVFEVKILTF